MLVGIPADLRTMFTDKQRGYAWVSRPNDFYDDRWPADVMANGSMFVLARIYEYVATEAAR
ncbi:hypothetical protein ASE61_11810 [Bosea sp. Root670]|uniref:hypothetical protein n=1 Tax=Bosea sp. Root670 TaxID=1736583 RepID=UPI000715B966|nr:hypothetical protein [Bosea sp. Root670]KRE03176.1 hypothetical protein ASE61_11810 [Bosea sp. Root670]